MKFTFKIQKYQTAIATFLASIVSLRIANKSFDRRAIVNGLVICGLGQ